MLLLKQLRYQHGLRVVGLDALVIYNYLFKFDHHLHFSALLEVKVAEGFTGLHIRIIETSSAV